MSTRLYNGKWDGIWDKPKYQRVRQKIWDAFDGIEFVEDTHQYFYKGREMIPTSNVCHLFRHHFDEDAQAQRCYEKYNNLEGHRYYGMTKEQIIESWHDNSRRATSHGTIIHLFGENCAYFMMRQYDKLTDDFKKRIVKDKDGREYVESREPKEEGIVKFWNDLPVSIIPIVFEIQMFSEEFGISGTADLLFLHDQNIELDDNDEEIMQRLYLMDYKGLPLDTPILTTKGWKTIGTINEGDFVYDKDANQSEVLHVSSIHHNPCYKMNFDDGDSIIADHQHRWLISFIQSEDKMTEKIMTTEDIHTYIFIGKKEECCIPKIKYIKKPLFLNSDNKSLNNYAYKSIISVEKVDTVPTRCIEVDSPSHTYLCGKNLLVTHNTNADLYKSFDYMKEPFDDMDDNDLSGYKLQAAIYSFFLENQGFGFVARALIWLRDYGNGNGGYEKVKMESLTKRLFTYLKKHPLETLMIDQPKENYSSD